MLLLKSSVGNSDGNLAAFVLSATYSVKVMWYSILRPLFAFSMI